MKQELCCPALQSLDGDVECPLRYVPYSRQYILTIPDYYFKKNTLRQTFQISHCPWCGARVPKSLYDEWHALIAEKFGITDYVESELLKQLPVEFTTDQWWKTRGL